MASIIENNCYALYALKQLAKNVNILSLIKLTAIYEDYYFYNANLYKKHKKSGGAK